MAKERVTLKNIADQLGLSVPTVSRALKNYPDISKETKAAVKKLVEELHYVPNSLALNLRKNKSNIIGVIIPEIVHFFFSSIIKGIMDTADRHGYSVLLTQSEENLELEQKHAKLLLSSHVDGILVCLSDETKDCEHFNMFDQFDIPMILFDKVNRSHQGSQIVINDQEAAFNATEHLIHQGCKNIIILKGANEPMNASERYLGYRKALESYGIPFKEELVITCKKISRPIAYDQVSSLVKKGISFDGVVGISDLLAVGALGACQDNGIKVPEDVCIIGFSDSEMCQITRPMLSSVYQPGFEMGQKATEKLISEINQIENEIPVSIEAMELKATIKIRESSNRLLKKIRT